MTNKNTRRYAGLLAVALALPTGALANEVRPGGIVAGPDALAQERQKLAANAQGSNPIVRTNTEEKAPEATQVEEEDKFDGKKLVTLPIYSARKKKALQTKDGSDIVGGTAMEGQGWTETRITNVFYAAVSEDNITEGVTATTIADESILSATVGVVAKAVGAVADGTKAYNNVVTAQAARTTAQSEKQKADKAVEIAAAGATKMNIVNTALGGNASSSSQANPVQTNWQGQENNQFTKLHSWQGTEVNTWQGTEVNVSGNKGRCTPPLRCNY